MDITVGAVIVAVVATIVGSTIQGAIGFGMNLVTVPALVLVLPEALPVAVIVLGIPISIAMVRHERHGLDRPGLAWLLSGRVPGTVLGALIVVSVSATSLQVIVGSVVLLLVVASAAMSPVAINRSTQLTAGFASGVTSTCAGIGGPPVALLYQRRGGAEIRSTLSATFLVGADLAGDGRHAGGPPPPRRPRPRLAPPRRPRLRLRGCAGRPRRRSALRLAVSQPSSASCAWIDRTAARSGASSLSTTSRTMAWSVSKYRWARWSRIRAMAFQGTPLCCSRRSGSRASTASPISMSRARTAS